jgi:molybdopterin molybdotransferase
VADFLQSMILVEQAENIIQSHIEDFGTENIPLQYAMGRILAEDIKTDRDLPPCNRATMDGIAIHYTALRNGLRSFHIKATQAAGDKPIEINNENECIEIMTGASVPLSTDTVIRYEDLVIQNGTAILSNENIKQAQNIHFKGSDKKENETVIASGAYIDATVINMAASLGKTALLAKRLPKIAVISTGNELVEITETPLPYQVRRSNSYAIRAELLQYGLDADMLHIPDDYETSKTQIEKCMNTYDAIILSGGISMGKFDYLPQVLEELSVKQLFYKVRQRPGKPFWFGKNTNGALVFAFPGNPVSTFMCLHRYFLPWLQSCLGISRPSLYAILNDDFAFAPALQYFLQVKLMMNEKGELLASPFEGNGSGDFANLPGAHAFMELPQEKANFIKGEVYRIWPFKRIFL